MIPSSSMVSTRESALKVSRSSSENSPANAPIESHQWVIFDAGDMVLENVVTSLVVLEVPWSCLSVTMYLPGRGFPALEMRTRGDGAARAGSTQSARAMSWKQNIIEKLATGDRGSQKKGLKGG